MDQLVKCIIKSFEIYSLLKTLFLLIVARITARRCFSTPHCWLKQPGEGLRTNRFKRKRGAKREEGRKGEN